MLFKLEEKCLTRDKVSAITNTKKWIPPGNEYILLQMVLALMRHKLAQHYLKLSKQFPLLYINQCLKLDIFYLTLDPEKSTTEMTSMSKETSSIEKLINTT